MKSQKLKLKIAFIKKTIHDLKQSEPGQWYSKLKRLCSYDEKKNEQIDMDEIKHLTNKEQAEKLAEFLAKTRQEYETLKTEDINIPYFN